jgi:hypothetical protein
MPKQIFTQYNEKTGKWENKKEDAVRSSSTANTKAEAQELAKEQAKKENLEHIIKNKDGKIAEKNSYGSDPSSIKG